MKMLLQNYSTPLSTEALYLHRCMIESKCDAVLWADRNISAFDIFDATNPDIFLTHFRFITQDILKYLSGSNIDVVLNITGADNQMINQIETEFASRKIKTKLLFTNTHEIMSPLNKSQTKLINILPGLDIFVPKQEVTPFNLPTCIVTSGNTDTIKSFTDKEESYHTIGIGTDEKDFDFNLDIASFISIIDRYDKALLVDDLHVVFSQLFFESTFRCPSTILQVPDNQKETLNKILATLFHDQEADNISVAIKEQIKRKHTCFNRTARFLKSIGCTDEENKVKRLEEQL